MIDHVMARHEVVRQLVEHGWLHLLRIDDEQALVERRSNTGWQHASALPGSPNPPAEALLSV